MSNITVLTLVVFEIAMDSTVEFSGNGDHTMTGIGHPIAMQDNFILFVESSLW